MDPTPTPHNGDARKRQANRTSFKPGQSGNPTGLPKPLGPGKSTKPSKDTLEALKGTLSKLDGVAVGKLKRIITSPYFIRQRPEVVLKAIELAWAYAYGRPKQQVDVTADGSGPLDWLLFLQQARALQAAGAAQAALQRPGRTPWQPVALGAPATAEDQALEAEIDEALEAQP